MRIAIVIASIIEAKIVQKFLNDHPKFCSPSISLEHCFLHTYSSKPFVIFVDRGTHASLQKASNADMLLTFDQLNALYDLPTIIETVQLNNEYSAEIHPTYIRVGCQTFPIDALEAIIEAYNRIKGALE